MTGNLPVVPTRASLSASGRAAAPSTIRSGGPQRFFGTRTTARPESFEQHTAHLQQTMQQSHVSPVVAGRTGAVSANGGGLNAGGARGGVNSVGGNENANRGGLRTPTPSGSNNMRIPSAQPERSQAPASRAESASPRGGETSRDEWRSFTPPAHANEPAVRGGGSGGSVPSARSESGSYWNRTAPSSGASAPRTSGAGRYEPRGGDSRPQLNMRQPIAQPRSYGGYEGSRGAPSGGSHSAPSYGGPRSAPPSSGGGHSAPSGGGSHSAPSSGGGSHPSGGSHH